MDAHKERILKDLGRTLITRIVRDAIDITQLCDAAEIPRRHTEMEISSTFLYLFMTLLSHNQPGLSPEELGRIVHQQYAEFKQGEAERAQPTHS